MGKTNWKIESSAWMGAAALVVMVCSGMAIANLFTSRSYTQTEKATIEVNKTIFAGAEKGDLLEFENGDVGAIYHDGENGFPSLICKVGKSCNTLLMDEEHLLQLKRVIKCDDADYAKLAHKFISKQNEPR